MFFKAVHPPLHEPSHAQKQAGNYAKRKLAWRGMTISIENEQGSMRRGTNRDGKSWEQRMAHPYGYFNQTEGVDGDHFDVFVGPNLEAPTVHVIQSRKVNRWDQPDEDKGMVGFNSAEEAKQGFLDSYSDPRFYGKMTSMPADEFVAKLKATKDKPALMKSEQLSLFDAPVNIPGSVRKDGVVIAPYTRIQKKAHKPPVVEPPKRDHATEFDRVQKMRQDANALDHERERRSYQKLPPDPDLDRRHAEADAAATAHNTAFEQEFAGGPVKKMRGGAKRTHVTDTGEKHTLTGKQWDKTTPAEEAKKEPPPPAVLAQFGAAGENKADRRRINAGVVDLITQHKTAYTGEDKQLMARYSGNGGCGDSLNEYYTDPAVATAMWTVIERLGVAGGTALEPSCGAGVFLHTAPPAMKVTGVEIDGVSAKVATTLHDRHEIRESSLEIFATGDERQFDAVVGNAPFGIRGGTLKDDKPDIATADSYFIDTAIDKARPGGIVAMIVNHGVMDTARDYQMRKRFLNKAEFLGAIRMPNTAFEHSHTEVTADIVFFKKRPQDVANALGVLNDAQRAELGLKDDEYLTGGYFEGRGAPNILGVVEPGWRAKAGMGNDITVAGSMVGVPEHIAAFEPDEAPRAMPTMANILALVEGDKKQTARILGAAQKRPYELTKPGSTKTVDGIEYILEGTPLRWHRMDEVMDRAAVTDAEDIAEAIDNMIADPAFGQRARAKVAAAVQAYVAKHGLPSKNHDLLVAAHQNQALYRLIGAVNTDGSLSDILTKEPEAAEKSSFETATQTLAAEELSGLFTPEDVAKRTGKSLADVDDLLHASNDYAYAGDGKWTTMPVYLTGELWPKLDAVTEALARSDIDAALRVKYELQQAKLIGTIDPKSMEDIDVEVNHAFIPVNILAAYFNQRRDESEYDFVRSSADLKIKFESGLYTVEGGDMSTRKLLTHYLNRDHVGEDDWEPIKKMNKDFKDWIMSSRFRDELETRYNRAFQGFVPPTFGNEKIDIPGMNTAGLKDYQYGGVRWALAHGKGIIAADVGLGKTVRALMIARLMKLEGKAKRNMIVVPKSVIGNWAKEAERWFPGSKVLTIGETITGEKSKADTADQRNKKYHQYMQNDYDFVFISQPAFNDLDVDPVVKGEYLEQEFWVQRGDALAGGKGEGGDKRIRKIREAHAAENARRQFGTHSDAIYFNDLGVDLLIADESHAYKNLYAVRNRFGQKPKFLGGGGLSNRALDMQGKTRSVRDSHEGKGVFFLTATPTKNSPLEIYSMLAHIAPEEFEKLGIRNSEEFLDRFCEVAQGPCLQTDATIEDSVYVSGFKNMDELRNTMKRYIDRTTAEEVGLVLPKRDEHLHLIDMSPEQTAAYEDLREQAKASKGDKGGDPESHIFSIMSRMGKAALDLELLDPERYAGSVSPKYVAMADNVATNVKDGGQIVFCEAIESHDKLKAALVAKGIPADQIAIFNAQTCPTGDDRQKIQDKFNAGKLKVVIGNKTMEEGVNLQIGTADIHHMDIAWEPATMQQRNGRAVRQGNVKGQVRIHTYLSKGSFDGYRYQAVSAKKSWQDLIWSGGDRVENLERPTITADEMMIMMSADPDAARIQMEGNKQAAQARYLADKTSQASTDFAHYQLMKHNHAKLKNKATPAAELLASKMKAAKARLAENPHFTAKAALESPNVVLLHPETGTILQHGAGIERDGKKYVVAGVDPTQQQATLRTYGGVGANAHMLTLPVGEMGANVKPFDYDEAAETAHMSKEFGEYADTDAAGALNMEGVRNLPAGVIHANSKKIQARLKRNLAEYKMSAPSGSSVAFMTAAGEAKVAASYAASDLAKRDDHDLMLPTPENRTRRVAEYAKAEQARELRAGQVNYKRGRSNGSANMTAHYQQTPSENYRGLDANPWAGAGAFVFGKDFPKEAHTAFQKTQGEHIRHAKTFAEAVRRAGPTIKTSYSGHRWPQATLAVLFARAKRDGILDSPLAAVVPKKMRYGSETDEIDDDVWKSKARAGSQTVSVRHEAVDDALITLAEHSGYNGLAAAMIVSAKPPAAAAKDLLKLPLTDEHVIAAVAHLATKHPELAAMHVLDHFDGNDYAMKQAVGHGREDLTFGQLADEMRIRAANPPATESEAA
jgi:SNF2 family DNA or RNA helicase/predicted RNA methylase